MNEEEISRLERAMMSADPSAKPGVKERVWRRATRRDAPASWYFRPLTLAAAAAAVALVVLWPGLERRLAVISPDWRAGELHAAELPVVAAQKSRRDRVDEIDLRYLEVSALYWAWRVRFTDEPSYEQLLGASKHWIGKPATKEKLMRRIKELLDTGKARPLTDEERRLNTEGTNKSREVLGHGPLGTPTERWPVLEEIDKIDARDRELSAMYWAWRIADVKDVTFKDLHGHSDRWIMKRASRDALFARIRSILDRGAARELTPAQARRLERGRREIRAILH